MSNTSTYYQNFREDMTQLLPKQYSRVLEIGCGEGKFRENLTHSHEYWGVEPVESAAAVASKKLDKVLIGTYQDVLNDIPDDYFDLVICNDVIEHMVDHDEFFQSIKKKMKKHGCLVASLPNVRGMQNLFELLVKKDWEYKDSGILDKTHLRFFTKKSLYRIINDNGFVIDQFMGVNSYRSSSIIKSCLYYLAILLLGSDVGFIQFGIRIRENK